MKLREFILYRAEIIKHIYDGIDQSRTSLNQVEDKILEHINRIG